MKGPAYRDTLDVEEPPLPGTVNTMPGTTPNATADHGGSRGSTATGGPARARGGPAAVERLGVSYDKVVAQSENEGVATFEAARQELLDAVTKSSHSKGVDAE